MRHATAWVNPLDAGIFLASVSPIDSQVCSLHEWVAYFPVKGLNTRQLNDAYMRQWTKSPYLWLCILSGNFYIFSHRKRIGCTVEVGEWINNSFETLLGMWLLSILGLKLIRISKRGPGCITMMTSSNGNFFRVTGPLCGEFTGPGEFPTQRPVTRRSFDVFYDLRLNKRLSKQPWGWWFQTLSWSLWRHCNDKMICVTMYSHDRCFRTTGTPFTNID